MGRVGDAQGLSGRCRRLPSGKKNSFLNNFFVLTNDLINRCYWKIVFLIRNAEFNKSICLFRNMFFFFPAFPAAAANPSRGCRAASAAAAALGASNSDIRCAWIDLFGSTPY